MNSKSLVLILLSIFTFNTIHADITWNISNGTLTISGTDMPDYETSSSIPWYSQRSEIKKVVIQDGVTNIGRGAFAKCEKLTSVTIPNSVTSIGISAFSGCSILPSITIPNSVNSIGNTAFANCTKLSSVIIPNSVTSIGEKAFLLCSALTSIVIPNSVTRIENNTFYQCYNLTSVTIPNSVTSIGNYAFFTCKSLISVTIPNSVTSIGERVFEACYALTSVTLPNSLTCIPNYTFQSCSALTSVTIPETVTSIGKSAFWRCTSLPSINIPNGVADIDSAAFYGCSSLTSISIPNSVTSIGTSAFCACSGILSPISIPYGVTSIKDNVFKNCSGIPSITIPSTVTSIGESAFYSCSSLTSINIPYGVTSIGNNTFYGCTSLPSITIPSTVTRIGTTAFSGCSGLTSISCEASTPPNCQSNSFTNVDKSIPVYVPDNCMDKYRKRTYWKDFTNIQAIPSTSASLTDGDLFVNSSRWEFCDISYTRTFNNTNWQALYIPFSISYDDWKDDFDVAYINGIRQLDTDDDNVIDETIMDVYRIESGSLIPNTPYLIRAKTTGEKTIYANYTALLPSEESSIDCSTTIVKYTFTGTYRTIPAATLIENGYYAMGGGAVIMTDGTSDLKPYRWYLKIEARSPIYNVANAAKAITIRVMDEESETTGVNELQVTNYEESPVYDLNGRKVDENTLKPGIYIKNGKKVVIK